MWQNKSAFFISPDFFPFLDELDKSKHFCRNFFFKKFFCDQKKFSRDLAEFSKLFLVKIFFSKMLRIVWFLQIIGFGVFLSKKIFSIEGSPLCIIIKIIVNRIHIQNENTFLSNTLNLIKSFLVYQTPMCIISGGKNF